MKGAIVAALIHAWCAVLFSGCAVSGTLLHDVRIDGRFDPKSPATEGIGVGGVVSTLKDQHLSSIMLENLLVQAIRRHGGYPDASAAELARNGLGPALYSELTAGVQNGGQMQPDVIAGLAALERVPRYLIFASLERNDVRVGSERDCDFAERTIGGRIAILDWRANLLVWDAGVSDAKRNQQCDPDDDRGSWDDILIDFAIDILFAPSPPSVHEVVDDLFRGVALALPKPPDGSNPVTAAQYLVVEPSLSERPTQPPISAAWEIEPATAWAAYREISRAAEPLSPERGNVIAIGASVTSFARAYFGDANGGAAAIRIRLQRFATRQESALLRHDHVAEVGLSFDVLCAGDSVFERTYDEQAKAESLRDSIATGLSRIFARFAADAGGVAATWKDCESSIATR